MTLAVGGAVGVCLALASWTSAPPPAAPTDTRLNQLQYIGTHNSYHIAPDTPVLELMLASGYRENADWPASRLVPALSYTHAPLTVQLDRGVRAFELDVFHDPEGGRFAAPGATRVATSTGHPSTTAAAYAEAMARPGFKVMHMADLDFRSTCMSLQDCLSELRAWSDATPDHIPLIVMIEPKESAKPPLADLYRPATVDRFDASAWHALESEILSVFPAERLVTPDLVRGSHATLRAAIQRDGWPRIDALRGRVMFVLGDSQEMVGRYLAVRPGGRHGVFFFDHGVADPETGWLYRSNPRAADIRARVGEGYLVYTRADAHTAQARTNSTGRRDRALAVGSVISTDYPWADDRLSRYRVDFPGGAYVRPHPALTR